MPAALEVISGSITNQAAFTALTMASGDTLTVRNMSLQAPPPKLLNHWAFSATAGTVRVRSPKLHDNVSGIRNGIAVSDARPLLPIGMQQTLYPQDTLIVEQLGGGAETDTWSGLIYYPDLPGQAARLYSWDQIAPRIQQYMTIPVTVVTGATLGSYGAGVAITSTLDLTEANSDYAILGYNVSIACSTIGFRGADLGNLRVGGPGTIQRDETRHWFKELAQWTGLPTIPVFNSANKGAVLVDGTGATNVSPVVDIICAYLGPYQP